MVWISDHLKKEYGIQLKKISIDAGFTCPNRDGTNGYGGCIFCSQKGSGDFTLGPGFSVAEQIESGRLFYDKKEGIKEKKEDEEDKSDRKYIAYFQAYTNTYADAGRLREIFFPVAERDDIAVISIATRPDCLGKDIIEVLDELSDIKPVWVELGLQTIHEKTAGYIRRGYPLETYDEAVKNLSSAGISQIITHVILGLPGETQEMMLDTVKYIGQTAIKYERSGTEPDRKALFFGIKLQLLHVLKNTDLAADYHDGKFKCMSFDEYTDTVSKCLKILPDQMVVHRITGDGSGDSLIAPLWSMDKKKVMNAIRQKMMDCKGSVPAMAETGPFDNIKIQIYENITGAGQKDYIPVFLYGTSKDIPGDGGRLFEEIKEKTDAEFMLMVYCVEDWNDDFSPWKTENTADRGYFGGNGFKTSEFIRNELIPFVNDRCSGYGKKAMIFMTGYSLAGLFSLWAYYENREELDGVICCSGSLWYPGYEEYLTEKRADLKEDSVGKNGIMYLSLGGKEAQSGNPVMDRVGDMTKLQFEAAKKDPLISKCRYDINKGGHFADPVKRITKGITWCLEVL